MCWLYPASLTFLAATCFSMKALAMPAMSKRPENPVAILSLQLQCRSYWFGS